MDHVFYDLQNPIFHCVLCLMFSFLNISQFDVWWWRR